MSDQQKDLLTGRWRTVRAPAPLEHQLQISLIEHLKWRCKRPDVTYFHVPNGELRDKRAAAKLKAMGVMPGVSDLEIMFGPHVLFLELKAHRRKLTVAQQLFGQRMLDHGHYFAWADNIDDAVSILRRYGIL
jgi:hypothetical protein